MQLEKSAENLAAVDGEPGGASPGGVQGDPSSLKRLLAVPGIVAIFVLLNFTVRAILATLETLSTYIISYLYTGSMDEAVWRADGAPFRVSETFTAIGLGGLVVFAGVYYLSGHFQDRVTLLLGLSFILAGLGLTLDPRDGEGLGREMSLMRFEAGLAAIWGIGYPLAQSESSPNSNANNLDSAGDLLLTCAATSLPPSPPGRSKPWWSPRSPRSCPRSSRACGWETWPLRAPQAGSSHQRSRGTCTAQRNRTPVSSPSPPASRSPGFPWFSSRRSGGG